MKRKSKMRSLAFDIFIDIVGGLLIAIGIYNFAANAEFPMTGISGIALIFYQLFGLPIGVMSMIMNIPIAIGCFKILGRDFFLRSVKTIIITSVIQDVIAPLLPVYSGERMLAAICTGIFAGVGYGLIYMNGTSTGGIDFITMSVRAKKPHISLGKIAFVLDFTVVLIGGAIYRNVDGVIYGVIISYILSTVVDKLMYGIDAGRMILIVTERAEEIAQMILAYTDRGCTFLKGEGSYSRNEKKVVMCACSNKQMYTVRRMVRKIDPMAFTVIMESNAVVGEGFKDE